MAEQELLPPVDNLIVKPLPTTETKKCSCCGKVKPLNEFYKRGLGYRSKCIACCTGEQDSSSKFKDFTSKELIDELKLRGYSGQLTKRIVQTFDL